MATALALDFLASEVLDARVTASGGANGTRVNSSGFIAAATCPRFDYDPVTRAPRGILIEEARTNLLTNAERFENGVWTKGNATIASNAAAAPDGATTADKLVESSGSAEHYVTQVPAFTGGAAYTFSFFAKAGERSVIACRGTGVWAADPRVRFALSGEGSVTVDSGTPTATITAFPNGWYRCTMTATPTSSGGGEFRLSLYNSGYGYEGDGISGLYIWGAQLEAGSFATSYIPTLAAAVTRSADNLTMTGTNFSSWFNAPEGTFVIDAELPVNVNAELLSIYDNSDLTANAFEIYKKTSLALAGYIVAGSAVQADMQTQNLSAGAHKFALAYKVNDCAACTDGGTVVPDTSASMPSGLTAFAIGRYRNTGSGYVNSRVRRIMFDNTRRSDADLRVLTVGLAAVASLAEGSDTIGASGTVKIKAAAAITEDDDVLVSAGEVGPAAIVPASRTVTI
ncbi:hypothetical protein [Rhizorhabdus sp.]|uniref:phage head spike fiber domain-containing protein n=1 Tax=Rhizorhabdus sp. TaxID=1968843 RepID=UPI0035B006B2